MGRNFYKKYLIEISTPWEKSLQKQVLLSSNSRHKNNIMYYAEREVRKGEKAEMNVKRLILN